MPIPRSPFRALLLGLSLLSPTAAQDWTVLPLVEGTSEGGQVAFVPQDDGSVRVEGGGDSTGYRLEFACDLVDVRALRLEALPDEGLAVSGPGRSPNGNFVLSEVRIENVVGRNTRPMEVEAVSASFAQVGWPVHAVIDGRADTGWAVDGAQGRASEVVLRLVEPLGRGARSILLELDFNYGTMHSIGRLRLSATSAEDAVAADASGKGELPIQIAAAIDKGTAWILGKQELDGSWSADKDLYPAGTTALNVYTLLKAGVPKDHPSVRRGLAFIDEHPPVRTYSAGCVLLAYAAHGGEAMKTRAEWILEDLLDWQAGGDWGYPGSHGNPRDGHKDLSNTQYGALGLWAAEQLGLEVPPYAWRRLAELVLRYQQRGDGASGFSYTPGGKPTGSMTAAGVGVLSLCEARVEADFAAEIRPAIERGLAWLDEKFDPTKNPGQDGNWVEYYLYGIERVGAFTGVETFDGQDWYQEGARALIKSHLPSGAWDRGGRDQATTAFAILFLSKASARASGPGAGRRQPIYGADDPAVDVNLRAAGDTPLRVWISSFGDDLRRGWTFEEDGKRGPRVARVDYVGGESLLVPDSRVGGAEWHLATKAPPEGWQAPDFDDRRWRAGRSGFGPAESRDLVVATPWDEKELWLRHRFEVELESLVEPRLEVLFASPATGAPGPRAEAVKLFDEEEEFAALLTNGPDASAELVRGDAPSGSGFLRVSGHQRHRARIPGWGFPLREDPGPGEFRFLRFSWRRRGGEGGVMLQVAIDGAWTRALRYHAGETDSALGASRALDKRAPANWDEQTVDLWQDLGGDGFVTGIAFSPLEGEAEFDAVYLARSRSAFTRALRQHGDPVPWGAAPETTRQRAGEGALVIWINGEEALELDAETRGHETWLEGGALIDHLRDGENVLAVRARNAEGKRALDLSLRDRRLLARVGGDPGAPAEDRRFAARVTFAWPGTYALAARVHLVDEAGGDLRVFESPPLEVRIQDVLPGGLLDYAKQGKRNLFANELERITASSERDGSPVRHLVDGRQSRAWLCAPGDPTPGFVIELDRPQKADALLLSPMRPDRFVEGASPARVSVLVNGKQPATVVEIASHPMQKTRVDVSEAGRIRVVEVRILDRHGGGVSLPPVGFAEVELVRASGTR